MAVYSVTYIIRCRSSDALRKAKETVLSLTQPNEEIARTFITFPRGIERREMISLRVGDYFDSVETNYLDPLSFQMTFQVSQKADRFWKDLVVSIIRSISELIPEVSAIPVPKPS
jgi:hypothetical protein